MSEPEATETNIARDVAIDGVGIALSFLCLLHCLALPLLSAFLPLAGTLSEMEWLHRAFVILALPVTLFAVRQSWRSGEGLAFPVLALTGLSLLALAAFVEPLHALEVALTTFGALILAFAHGWRWKTRRHPVQYPVAETGKT